jgi:hypothetical protein
MSTHHEDRLKHLLQQALPPVDNDIAPSRDLWHVLQRRLNAKPEAPALPGWAWVNVAWFDGVLLAGLVGLAALFPSSIPLLLYYL